VIERGKKNREKDRKRGRGIRKKMDRKTGREKDE
jgi:hypothetical protein